MASRRAASTAVIDNSSNSSSPSSLTLLKRSKLSPFASAETLAQAYAPAVTPVAPASPFVLVNAPRSPRAQIQQLQQPKRRAHTAAAQMQTRSQVKSDDAALGTTPAKPRPQSGPLAVGMRPRATAAPSAIPTWSSVQSPPVTAASLAMGLTHGHASEAKKSSSPAAIRQPVTAAPKSVQRAPLITTVGQRNKAPLPSQAGAALARLKAVGPRPRPAQIAASKAQANDRAEVEQLPSDGMLGATPYAILSPTSAAAAAPSAPASLPGRFDPFVLMHDPADHLVSLAARRFIVGRLSCCAPSMVHFKPDRLCYMFSHPGSPDTQIMMELHYDDMVDARCSPAGGVGAFSFKVPHFLPAFDAYGDYEPSLRNHRITVEFTCQADMQRFRQQVYASVQLRAVAAGRR